MSTELPTEIPYRDVPDLAETFSDRVRLVHFDGYSVRLEFVVSRPVLAGQDTATYVHYPCARLVLPPMAMVELHEQLGRLMGGLEKEGLLKRVAPTSTTKQ